MKGYWTQLDGVWHQIESTSTGSGGWFVTTVCGITAAWNQVQIDRLPGGGEEAHPACLTNDTPQDEETKPKRKSKKASD